jgi:hypothetical protein
VEASSGIKMEVCNQQQAAQKYEISSTLVPYVGNGSKDKLTDELHKRIMAQQSM